MNDRILYLCILGSFLIHAVTISTGFLMIHRMPATPVHIPIQLVNVSRAPEVKTPESSPPSPAPKPKAVKVAAPKLLSKPEIFETLPRNTTVNTNKEIKEPDRVIEPFSRLASPPSEPGSLKGGRNVGERASEAAAGAGNLFGTGDIGVVDGNGLSGGRGGSGTAGIGEGTKSDGIGGGVGSGNGLSSPARPLGGYQVKPSYPESARRAGAQGTTLLKLHILENGKVGEVQIEQSAGHPDLDTAAADAVRKWLFEPARIDKRPLAVWVLVPVKFELH